MTGIETNEAIEPNEASETNETDPVLVKSRIASHRRKQRPVQGRTTAIVAVALVVLGVALVSAAVPEPSAEPAVPAGDGTAVSPADAHASSFFCTTGSGLDAGSGAASTVVLVNTTHSAVHGTMATTVATATAVATPTAAPVATAAPAPAVAVRKPVTVPPLGTIVVTPAEGMPAGATASTFAFSGGGVTGTAIISSPQGWSTAPCASEVSAQWDFAGGATATGLLDLSLYNPTAAPTVVGATFRTANGNVLTPQEYQGILLAPGQLVVENLGAYVQSQAVVATLVRASSGSLVATELDQMVVASGSGLALMSGTPGPSTTWRFAQTTAVQGGTVTLALANPNVEPVTVLVTVGLSGASVEPRRLRIPARTVASFAASATAGWPLGSPYSLTVSSSEPIVVGRTVVAPAGAASPQGGISPGATTATEHWLVVGPGGPGAPAVAGATRQSLAVAVPGPSAVDVTVTRLDNATVTARARVAAHGTVVFGPDRVGGLDPLVVTASGPVTVEADDGPSGAPGVVAQSGLPLGP